MAAFFAAVAADVVVWGVVPALQWEARLRQAAEPASWIAELRPIAAKAGAFGGQRDEDAFAELKREVQDRVTYQMPSAVSPQELWAGAVSNADFEIADWMLGAPASFEPFRPDVLSELAGHVALFGVAGPLDSQYPTTALFSGWSARLCVQSHPRSARAAAVAAAHQERWHGHALFESRLADTWERVLQFDPHSLAAATRAASAPSAAGNGRAAEYARRALQIDRNMRLDPLKQLDEATRFEMERIARSDGDHGAAAAPEPRP